MPLPSSCLALGPVTHRLNDAVCVARVCVRDAGGRLGRTTHVGHKVQAHCQWVAWPPRMVIC